MLRELLESDFGKLSEGGGKHFQNVLKYEVGDGSKVGFWLDVWCGDVPLKISYLDLFSIACNKDARVVDNS
jgi:hypothetical protein